MKQNRWLVHFLLAIILLAAGIFILVRKELFKQVFIMAIGVVAIVFGTVSLASISKYALGKFTRGITLVKGVLSLIIGVLAIVMPLATGEAIWTILIYILAAQMSLSAIITIFDALAIRSKGFPIAPLLWEAFISLLFALILFMFPQSIANLVVTILGLIIIVIGLTIGILALTISRRAVRVETDVKNVEVEVIDEK